MLVAFLLMGDGCARVRSAGRRCGECHRRHLRITASRFKPHPQTHSFTMRRVILPLTSHLSPLASLR